MKYPAVYIYKETEDDGEELRYSIRSLKNIEEWNGKVVVIGDKPSWLSKKAIHIPVKHTNHEVCCQNGNMTCYYNAELKWRKIDDPRIPDNFIAMNDDFFCTTPSSLGLMYSGQLTGYPDNTHGQSKNKTRNWLSANGHNTFNYEIHVPMIINKQKRLEVSEIIKDEITTGPVLFWRSIYGNLFHKPYEGRNYIDQKSRDGVLSRDPWISTSFFTPELARVFPERSQFEIGDAKEQPYRIAAILHYYIEQHGSGGEHYAHSLLKELAKKHEVHAYITLDKGKDTIIDGVHVHYDGYEGFNKSFCDVLITHLNETAKCLVISKQRMIPQVTIVHNDREDTKDMLLQLDPDDLAVFNTNWVKEVSPTKANTVVVHPPCKLPITTPGDHITLVNLTPDKGVDVFYEMAKRFPDQKFLGVKGGYWKDRQVFEELPNLTIIENTDDMTNDVYKKTKIILMPSTYESFGMVAREAGQSGIPVICTPTDGLKENLGDAGIYVEVGDYDGYEKAIEKLLVKANYNRASKKIKEHIKATTNDKQLEAFVKAVEELL